MKLAIIGAMPQEIDLIKANMTIVNEVEIAQRTYYEGTLLGIETVLVLSRVGKVSAAVTTSILLERFNVDHVIFTGVAGGLGHDVNIGDIVISDSLVQHDMNAFPIFPKHEIPLLGISVFQVDKKLLQRIHSATSELLTQHLHEEVDSKQLQRFNVKHPRIHVGTIVSGDQFICDPIVAKTIVTSVESLGVSNVACVEMEGAAFAQVCYEYGVPFVVVRTISDKADFAAPVNFNDFVTEVASHFSHGVIHCYFSHLRVEKA